MDQDGHCEGSFKRVEALLATSLRAHGHPHKMWFVAWNPHGHCPQPVSATAIPSLSKTLTLHLYTAKASAKPQT
jgi:hypothetical protein